MTSKHARSRSRKNAPAEFTTYYDRDAYFSTADIETALVTETDGHALHRLQGMLDTIRGREIY